MQDVKRVLNLNCNYEEGLNNLIFLIGFQMSKV